MIIDGQDALRAKDSEKIGDPVLPASVSPLLIEAGTTGLRGDFYRLWVYRLPDDRPLTRLYHQPHFP